MQTTTSEFPALPAGFVAVKIGGRPKKEARDAAIFLAKHWGMEVHGAAATKVEQWIVDTWEALGKEASTGIGEAAHARAALKRARDRGLNSSLLMIDWATGLCTAVECKKKATGATMKDGARSWHWVAGMAEAAEGEVKNLKVTAHQEIMHRSPVAVAVTSLMRGRS